MPQQVPLPPTDEHSDEDTLSVPFQGPRLGKSPPAPTPPWTGPRPGDSAQLIRDDRDMGDFRLWSRSTLAKDLFAAISRENGGRVLEDSTPWIRDVRDR